MVPQGFTTSGLVTLAVDLPAGVTPIGWVECELAALWCAQDQEARWQDGPDGYSPPGDGRVAPVGPTGSGFEAGSPRLVVRPDPGLFTAIARAALARGALTGWRDELFDVTVPSTGERLFTLERSAFRLFGLRSQAAQLVAYRPDGSVWVARRSRTKAIDPGLLDTLVGGGVSAGENAAQTLLREAGEEAGLTRIQTAQARCSAVFELLRRATQGVQHEQVVVFELEVDVHWRPHNGDGEVEAFLCLDAPEIARRIAAGEFAYEAGLSLEAVQAQRDQRGRGD